MYFIIQTYDQFRNIGNEDKILNMKLQSIGIILNKNVLHASMEANRIEIVNAKIVIRVFLGRFAQGKLLKQNNQNSM